MFRFALGYLLSPRLGLAAALGIAGAVAVGYFFGALLLGLFLVVALAALLIQATVPLVRWLRLRMNPVRRRYPRPTAWHQWR
jgi:hypothetical protein